MSNTLFSVATDVLDIHYVDEGPRHGHPVILLHGWPDAPGTWDRIVPSLHEAGLRTIRPYLRGFGPTRFLHDTTPRSAQIGALAQDAVDLADSLGLQRFSLVGHDWGARAGYLVAARFPDRVQSYVALSVGYGPGELSVKQARQFWYQWFFAHPQGEQALQKNHRHFTRELWQSWAPDWQIDDAAFLETAAAFDNPDWQTLTLHGYRHRWGLADGDPHYAEWDHLQSRAPRIDVPTLLLHGQNDTCIGIETSEARDAWFGSRYQRVVLPRTGHFPQREQPAIVADTITEWVTRHDLPLPLERAT